MASSSHSNGDGSIVACHSNYNNNISTPTGHQPLKSIPSMGSYASVVEEREDGHCVIVTKLRSCRGTSPATSEEEETAASSSFPSRPPAPAARAGFTAAPAVVMRAARLPEAPPQPIPPPREEDKARARPLPVSRRTETSTPRQLTMPSPVRWKAAEVAQTPVRPRSTPAAVTDYVNTPLPSLTEALAPEVGAAAPSVPLAPPRPRVTAPQPLPLPPAPRPWARPEAETAEPAPGPLVVPAPVPAALGALVLVPGRRGRCPDGWSAVTAAETDSYQSEVLALQAQLADAELAVRRAERDAQQQAEAHAAEMVQAWRDEERERRQQFQLALDRLREENAALTSERDGLRRGSAMGLAGAAPQQAEWERREQEVESYWRERLRTAEARWEAELNEKELTKQSLLSQVRELTRAAEQLEERVHYVEREKDYLVREGRARQRCLTAGDQREDTQDDSAEVAGLRQTIAEHERREQALLVQLDAYGEEAARREAMQEEQLERMRQELQRERRRSAELVELYSAQAQSLHQQLQEATGKRQSGP